MPSFVRNLAACSTLLVLASCSTQPAAPVRVAAEPAPDTAACIADLDSDRNMASRALDSGNISIVNWNIQKGRNTEWVRDLSEIGATPDLLILQEASVKTSVWRDLVPDHHSSFAEGFGPDWSPSGVMTVSAAEPLTECELVAHEPWFGTRKATLITEYALSGTEQTLLVVNIHGINFALGISDLENQFAQAKAVIAEHDGPVVFSGDFNTWRSQRAKVLEDMLASLGLTALDFDVDHRKRFFGWALDHIYVRGLYSEQATTLQSSASDHNPMTVQLRLSEEPLGGRDRVSHQRGRRERLHVHTQRFAPRRRKCRIAHAYEIPPRQTLRDDGGALYRAPGEQEFDKRQAVLHRV
jgi:endonuclease/exonuclease/phosphatase (EEP) superfamily protein YafD